MLRGRHHSGGIFTPHAYPLVDESAREMRRDAARLAVLVLVAVALGGSLFVLARRGHQVEVEQAYRQGLQEGLQGAQSCRGTAV